MTVNPAGTCLVHGRVISLFGTPVARAESDVWPYSTRSDMVLAPAR
jgi:hypothetical protein